MQNQQGQIENILAAFNLPYQQILGEKYKIDENKGDQDKKLRKKLTKYQITETDSIETANEKCFKLIQEFTKNYQITSKQLNKIGQLKKTVDQAEIEKNNALKQKEMFTNLYKSFKARYDSELEKAQQVQKQEQVKRKQVIESLQERIKTIQTKYEQAGKNKIEKYRQNQTLKHELMKLQPHLMASQALYEAQLKKKAIEIEIQMTTLKQKVEMMDNFKGMKAQTLDKIEVAKMQEQKITNRLKKITDKQDQHKILLAKAHLVFEDYKKALTTLKNVLPKKQKQALDSKAKARDAQNSLKNLKKQIADLDNEIENLIKQKQVLQTLQSNLMKQLQEPK